MSVESTLERPARLSVLGRHTTGAELAAYAEGALRSGRAYGDLLDDAFIRTRVAGRPDLLEDLASSPAIHAAIDAQAAALRDDPWPAWAGGCAPASGGRGSPGALTAA